MPMGQIPIENLYYLLSYAWDHFRDGGGIDVSATSCPDVENLMAKLLGSSIHHLSRTGFERDYLPITESTPRLKGRIHVAESYLGMTPQSGRMICEFDELSHDTPANRLLKSVAWRLLRAPTLTKDNRHALRAAFALIPEARIIPVTDSCFSRIQLHRNTRNYRYALGICQLIHRSLLPEEHTGSRRFRDLLRDEITMSRLFEAFVKNFAIRHCPGSTVSAMTLQWQATEMSGTTADLLPQMITDVTIAWPQRKLILDCKYYQDALTEHHGNRKFKSANLYQLHAYLTNKAVEPGWEQAEGMLLYPTNGYRLDHSFLLHGRHRVRLCTIDLQQPWNAIERDLKQILNNNCIDDGPNKPKTLEIGDCTIDEHGSLHVTIAGHRFRAGDKYGILEFGWAVYLAEKPLPDTWIKTYGETRPAMDGWSEIATRDSLLMTSHPVLVALSLCAWWHSNDRPIATAPHVTIPTFDQAVEQVRQRVILNDCNRIYAGMVPGLERWATS